MIPARLKTGDKIRIIAPSRTIDAVGGFLANQSTFDKLLKMGFKPTFGEYVTGMTPDASNSISDYIKNVRCCRAALSR